MAKKEFILDSIGSIGIYKRKGTRAMRLRLDADGSVRVTMPYWLPYNAGVRFALSRKDWILEKKPKKEIISHDTFIGKRHRIVFIYKRGLSRPKITTSNETITANIPLGLSVTSPELQQSLYKASIDALRTEAKDYLPQRLDELATSHNFAFNSVSVKKLRSRWGSCTSEKNISLNIYLMQLESRLIDYVLLHELLHTEIQSHGPRFWKALSKYVTELPEIRKEMRSVEPRLFPR